MQWLSDAVSSVQHTLQEEKDHFFGSTVFDCGAVPSTAASSSSEQALEQFKRATRAASALLNPLGDPESMSAGTSSKETGVIMLPWEQPGLSAEVRARMRALSQDRSVFLTAPEGGGSFVFDMNESVALVVEALSVDKHLEKQRHLMVPSEVPEETFFTNYFAHLHTLAAGLGQQSRSGAPSASDHSPGTAGSALHVAASFSSDGAEVLVTPLEEQFECLSDEFLANAVASQLQGSLAEAHGPADGHVTSEAGAADYAHELLGSHAAEDACASALSWEAELRAELDSP